MAKKDSAKPAAVSDKKRKRPTPWDGQYPVRKIELTVAHVGFGGNAGKGHYFYSFAPDVVTFQQPGGLWIEYAFEAQVPERFEIRNVLTSDAKDQIGPPVFDPSEKDPDYRRRVYLFNRNTESTLIFFTVLVRDRLSNYNDVELISCDPQVGNDPQIVPGAIKGEKPKKSKKG
ncbi:hypothetical protein [Lysobacter enzymogenes]|uniref:Uncharacterized protein n=1 Tax=Lysobacter enzymogenes TaxID=69 RepID=A0AAU9AV71_LYSEN|nr:hypothetical protein [Lysobacter enzymogenes]BAV98885.1 conserved hypothetical protein [Lysobacter enzymogenes]